MKPLTPQQIKGFVRMVAETRDHELNCSECRERFGEFAEKQLASLPIDEAMALVQQHLLLCPECEEELEALQRVLRA